MALNLSDLLNPAPDDRSMLSSQHASNETAAANEAAQAMADLYSSTAPRPIEDDASIHQHVAAVMSEPDFRAHEKALAESQLSSHGHAPSLITSHESSQPLSTLLMGIEEYATMSSPPPNQATDDPEQSKVPCSTESMKMSLADSVDAPSQPVSDTTEALSTADATTTKVPTPTEHASDSQSGPISPSGQTIPQPEQDVKQESTEPAKPSKKRPAPSNAVKKGQAKGSAKMGRPRKKPKLEPGQLDTKTARRASNAVTKLSKSGSVTPRYSSPVAQSMQSASEVEASDDDDQEDEYDSDDPAGSDDAVYCICRKPDNGTFMIGCDGQCNDWFHAKCVGITEKDKNLIDRYICPDCEKEGIRPTTWKRMCRRQGCRMPARLGTKKNLVQSKYCSEDCGVRMFETALAKTRQIPPDADQADDLGPLGGTLSAPELKALVTSSKTIEDFKRLGGGVLSPPSTPATDLGSSIDRLSAPQEQRLSAIEQAKTSLCEKHALFKDQNKFITMMKDEATRIAESKGLKPKDMCGYDPRVSWDHDEFDAWRKSLVGNASLSNNSLQVPDAVSNRDGDKSSVESQICMKEKCARHHEWARLALDQARAENADNSESMRALEKEEQEIRQNTGIRAREALAGRDGGHLIVHEKPTSSMQIDKLESQPRSQEVSQMPTPTAYTPGPRNELNEDLAVDGEMDADMVMNDATAT